MTTGDSPNRDSQTEWIEALGRVARAAKWLFELVDRDAASGDRADLQCLKNHGLVWSELDTALTAAGMQPDVDRSPVPVSRAKPIQVPGEVIRGSIADALGPRSPEADAEFKRDLEAIREAERRAWIDSQGIILG